MKKMNTGVLKRISTILIVLVIMTGTAVALQTGDVVFVIDESGSMITEISDVQNNVNTIFTNLQAQGDFAVGLVGFGSSLHANPRVICPVTTDQAAFQNCANLLTPVGGYYQPGFDAVVLGTDAGDMGLRGNPLCTIMITDEDADAGSSSKTDAITALNSVSSVFLGVYDPTFGSADADYGMATGLAGATGGVVFTLSDFRTDPSGVLTIILNECTTHKYEGEGNCDPNTQTCTPSPNVCSDGIDNDGDGFTDMDDEECVNDAGGNVCSDGLDNDGDGLIDAADPNCNVVVQGPPVPEPIVALAVISALAPGLAYGLIRRRQKNKN